MLCLPNLGGSEDFHPVGLKFRDLDPEAKKKYDQPSGQIARLFNLRALRTASQFICVTEGEMDTISLTQAGLPSIAVPGANHWSGDKKYRSRLLDGFQVILCYDSDEAGQALVRSMIDLPNLDLRSMAPWKDANDMLIATDEETLYMHVRYNV